MNPPGPRQSVGILRLHKHVPGTASPLYSLPETQARSSTVFFSLLPSSSLLFTVLASPATTRASLIIPQAFSFCGLYSTLATLGNDRTTHILLPASLHLGRRRSDLIRISHEGLACLPGPPLLPSATALVTTTTPRGEKRNEKKEKRKNQEHRQSPGHCVSATIC